MKNQLKSNLWELIIIIIFIVIYLIFNNLFPYMSGGDMMAMAYRLIALNTAVFIMGLLWGVKTAYPQRKLKGEWRFCKSRLFILALPFLILSFAASYGDIFALFIFPTTLERATFWMLTATNLIKQNGALWLLFPLISGYSLITAFYKRPAVEEGDFRAGEAPIKSVNDL